MGVESNIYPRLAVAHQTDGSLDSPKIISAAVQQLQDMVAVHVPKPNERGDELNSTLKRKYHESERSHYHRSNATSIDSTVPILSESRETTSSPEAVHAKKPKTSAQFGSVSPKRRVQSAAANTTTGRWTSDEHRVFLQGLATFGREWKRVAAGIPTRSSAQVRSHAQKYFSRLDQKLRDAESGTEETDDILTNPDRSTPNYDAILLNEVPLSDSGRKEAARILAHPETAEAEVSATLELLRERYLILCEKLAVRQQQQEDNERRRMSDAAAVVDDELVAIRVLQGGLMRSGMSNHQQESVWNDDVEEMVDTSSRDKVEDAVIKSSLEDDSSSL